MKTVGDSKLKEAFIDAHDLRTALSPPLLAALRLVSVEAGEHLVTQSDRLSHLYLLVQGKLQVENYDANGMHIVFSFETDFSVIGDLELFSQAQRSVFSSVQAVTDALIFTLPIEVIRERAMRDPAFLTFMCRQLSDKLLNASLLHASGGLTAEYKLRKFLLFKIKDEGVQIQLENRELLAGRLGISVRQLSRALAQLAADGMIQFKNKSLRVTDRQRLSGLEDNQRA
ncbi:cyclic nucleotide-binding domain-containing protein [Serratia sp. YC16]|uniref:Cyclic nucleotide-binding domain-containing protein n=1 Tax=Serratia surfactantfaciens TaxID=2741499 RepID=A0ABS0M4V0_9GAMM|nr:cyclic nucleotide-binding domain-containing protein [Serratia surfactantfaciens]MTD09143.1 cyclic nucleotide-binding domain-containing protein [Serratia sp. YC16]